MKKNDAIKNLKEGIINKYETENTKLQKMEKQGIFRGHRTTMSTEIEDNIALLIKNILPNNYQIFIDPSITINKKNYRPDIIIIDNNTLQVKAMLEIKANMGYCRDAKKELEQLKNKHKVFYDCKNLNLKYSISKPSEKEIIYSKKTKCFFIVYSNENCTETNHKNNKSYAKKLNIPYLILFDGWYNEPKNRDIETFIKEIKKQNKNFYCSK